MTLLGLDGNAFSLLGAFANAARQQGWTREEINKVRDEATSGNYDHLLCTLMRNTEPEDDGEDYEDDGRGRAMKKALQNWHKNRNLYEGDYEDEE